MSEYFAFIYIYIYAWCPRRLEKMVAESCKTRVTERRELWVLVTESGPLARAPRVLLITKISLQSPPNHSF